MTDSPNSGDRVDTAIVAAQRALADLRAGLAEKSAEIGQEVNAKVDALQAAIDDIQTARGEAAPAEQQSQMSGDPNDPAQNPTQNPTQNPPSGGTPPPASPKQ